MPTSDPQVSLGPYGAIGPPAEAMDHIGALVHQLTGLEGVAGSDGTSIHSVVPPSPPPGIQAYHLQREGRILCLRLQLLRTARTVRVPAEVFFTHLATLGEKVRLSAPASESSSGETGLWVEVQIQAASMSPVRSAALVQQIKKLGELALVLRQELPDEHTQADLEALYQAVAEVLEPIFPLAEEDPQLAGDQGRWANGVLDFLQANLCLALATPGAALEDYALAQLANQAPKRGLSLGRVAVSSLNPRVLLEITAKAPGAVVVPVQALGLGGQPYERGEEVPALLERLTRRGQPVLITGGLAHLQGVLHGGQGGTSNPLQPVVCHPLDPGLPALVRAAVAQAGRRAGGLAKKSRRLLGKRLEDYLDRKDLGHEASRLLPALATRVVRAELDGEKVDPLADFAQVLVNQSETLSGLSPRPRAQRSERVQARLVEVLTDPALGAYFSERIFGQQAAIEALVSRLRMECLTRPLHQPLRLCLQGTPGTGKSESVQLLAQRLGMAVITFDAASLGDLYTANSQLLGSARGIVGSHQSGRLEQAAKHPGGVVLEVCDLDHAPANIRAGIADIFMQPMELGEAQSSTGAPFSCSDILLVFTVNLPDGEDERLHRGFGFGGTDSDQLRHGVSGSLKQLFSGAFMSRLGEPVLFRPLSAAALATLVERAVVEAVHTVAQRTGQSIAAVDLAPHLGRGLVDSLDLRLDSFGARALIEQGRRLAAEAFVALVHQGTDLGGKHLQVGLAGDQLRIEVQPKTATK